MNEDFEIQYKNLNPKQREAVSTIEGPVMVVAGPGTGKTTILTLRIANILKETDTQPENILALTFTESAVFSMRKKLVNLIGPTAYRVNIFTFHGFCNNLIENYPEYYEKIISSKAITEPEQLSLIEKIIKNNNFSLIKPIGDQTYYVTKIKSAISHLKKEGFTPKEYKEKVKQKILEIESDDDSYNKKTGKFKSALTSKINKLNRSLELADVYEYYQKEMVEQKTYDFDDMILETLGSFDNKEDFLLEQQEKYQYLLADEHQDTNYAQNRILELLADFHESPNIFIVGDEKQAIFRFQGASLDNFLYFKNRFKDTKIIQLEDNYRSTQNILDSSHELISKNQTDDSLKIKLKSYKKGSEPILFREYNTQDEEDWGVASEIKNKINKGVDPNDIAIIYRNNSDILGISKTLRSFDIPFFIKSKQNILESPDYFRIKIILNAISQPTNIENILSFINLDFLSIDPIDASELTRKTYSGFDVFKLVDKSKKDDFNDLEALKFNLNTLKEISNFSKNNGALEVFEKMINDFGLMSDIMNSSDSIERISVINKIYEELKKNNLRNSNYLISDFIKYLDTLETYNLDLETYVSGVEEGVSLMTAHGSKGLEFDYVFIIYASQRKWGKTSQPTYFYLPYINTNTISDKNIEDERRLFYVAITRAKEKVYISYSKFDSDSKENTPSQFISELDKDILKIESIEKQDHKEIIRNKLKFIENKNNDIKNKKYLNKLFLERPMSVTALNNYLECPWRYFYSNLIRIPMPTTESLALGNAIHASLKWYVDNINKKSSFKEFEEIFNLKLDEQNINSEMKEDVKREAYNFLEGYFNNYLKKIDSTKEFYTEYTINDVFLDINKDLKIRLKGNLDRLDITNSNNVSVTDYKTTKPRSENDIKGNTRNSNGSYYRQLVFYKLLVDNHKNWKMQNAELSFVKPDDKDKFISRSFEINDDEVSSLKKEIIRVSNEILNLDFIEKECGDPNCRYCKMKNILN